MSGQANPVIATVAVSYRQNEAGESAPQYRLSTYDANTNARVVLSARKPKAEEVEAPAKKATK
jgi:hypothetical protein